MWSVDRPGIEFRVVCDVAESVEYGEIFELYDVTQLWTPGMIGRSHEDLDLDLLSSFFLLSLMAIDINWSITALKFLRLILKLF